MPQKNFQAIVMYFTTESALLASFLPTESIKLMDRRSDRSGFWWVTHGSLLYFWEVLEIPLTPDISERDITDITSGERAIFHIIFSMESGYTNGRSLSLQNCKSRPKHRALFACCHSETASPGQSIDFLCLLRLRNCKSNSKHRGLFLQKVSYWRCHSPHPCRRTMCRVSDTAAHFGQDIHLAQDFLCHTTQSHCHLADAWEFQILHYHALSLTSNSKSQLWIQENPPKKTTTTVEYNAAW